MPTKDPARPPRAGGAGSRASSAGPRALVAPARALAARASRAPPVSRYFCFRGSPALPRLALTFDDGPNPVYTPAVLDILARRGARATFFVLGREVERYPDLLRAIARGGHEVGIHGYDHSSRDLPGQARRTRDLLAARGVTARLFRPPRGHLGGRDALALALAGYRTVLWSLDARDSLRAEGKASARRDYAGVSAGEIVLMHDDNDVCLGELDELITAARRRGLAPVAVSDLA